MSVFASMRANASLAALVREHTPAVQRAALARCIATLGVAGVCEALETARRDGSIDAAGYARRIESVRALLAEGSGAS